MGKKKVESRAVAFGMYSHLLDSFEHLNKLQVVYRNLVSVWLLAAFGAMGFALSTKASSLPLHPLCAIATLCIVAYVGVSLICYLDYIVSERSMAILVHDAKALEKKYPFLPQIVFSCEKLNHLVSFINMKGLFYGGCYGILILTFFASSALFLFTTSPHFVVWLVLAGIFLLCVFFSGWMLLVKHQEDPYQKIEKSKGHDR